MGSLTSALARVGRTATKARHESPRGPSECSCCGRDVVGDSEVWCGSSLRGIDPYHGRFAPSCDGSLAGGDSFNFQVHHALGGWGAS